MKKVQFLIDSVPFTFIPISPKTETGYGGLVHEWIDEEVQDDSKAIIDALCKANEAKMKLVGSEFYDEKPITKAQIQTIKETVEMYRAMGGIL